MKKEIRDGYIFSDFGYGRIHMHVFIDDLQEAVPYILEHRIESVFIELVDPIALHESCRLNDSSILFNARKPESIDIDLSCMRDCREIVELSLEGNILHGEVLESFPMLDTLYIDNDYGRKKTTFRKPLGTARAMDYEIQKKYSWPARAESVAENVYVELYIEIQEFK